MAETNYVIAIGGTGGRVTRALLHICDCGHLDIKEIKLLVIDPDIKNGNKDSLQRMLNLYGVCHDNFHHKNSPLFKTAFTKAMPAGGSTAPEWTVSPVTGAPGRSDGNEPYHLNDYVGNEGVSVANDFMRAIYSHDEYATKDMNEGFFAHPSIGAHTFARWLDRSERFNAILTDMKAALTNGNVKVFIIGSSFGGTGASGFPAVARKIRTALDEVKSRGNNKVIISGAFYLPYFMFMPKDKEGNEIDEQARINDDDFLKAAKNALAFYDDDNAVAAYDRIYVLGAPSEGNVKIYRNYYADKGANQNNWPHMLELFGALAAKDFFESADDSSVKIDNAPPWWGIGVRQESFYNITWEDLPNSLGYKKLLNTFLLTSYVYVPAVLHKFIKIIGDQPQLDIYKNCKSFDPINKKPFTKGSLIGNDWSDGANGFVDMAIKHFLSLNEYFFEHAIWFAQMLHAFTADGKFTQALFERLVNCDLLRLRAMNAWNTETFADNIGSYLIENANFTYGDITASIARDVPKLITSHDVHTAIGELVRGVYAQAARFVN